MSVLYIKCLPQVIDALADQKKLTGGGKHIFLTKDGNRMTPDHFRKEVWSPALEKVGIPTPYTNTTYFRNDDDFGQRGCRLGSKHAGARFPTNDF
jgi:hypothetical protein